MGIESSLSGKVRVIIISQLVMKSTSNPTSLKIINTLMISKDYGPTSTIHMERMPRDQWL